MDKHFPRSRANRDTALLSEKVAAKHTVNRDADATERLADTMPCQDNIETERFVDVTRPDPYLWIARHAPVILPAGGREAAAPGYLSTLCWEDLAEYVDLRADRGKQIGTIAGIALMSFAVPLAVFAYGSLLEFGQLTPNYLPGILFHLLALAAFIGAAAFGWKSFRSDPSRTAKARFAAGTPAIAFAQRQTIRDTQSDAWRRIAPMAGQLVGAGVLLFVDFTLLSGPRAEWTPWQITATSVLIAGLAAWIALSSRRILGELYATEARRRILALT